MKTWLLTIAFAAAAVSAAGAQTSEETVAELTQEQVGMGFSGGNPVPGASSTLGIRLSTFPRVSVALRSTGLNLTIPDFNTASNDDELSSFIRSTNVDVAIGIFSGLSLVPTIGGFGSIDLLASYGKMSLPNGDGYDRDPTSWGAGVRVGILRESFTAPGLAVSGMYRRIGDIEYTIGEPEVDAGTVTRMENTSALSLRGTIGKRILMLGAVAGIGYDYYSTEARTSRQFGVTEAERSSSTTTVFANLSWTMLILHIVGEGGVLRGAGDNSYFGSLAVRLAL